MGNHGKRLEALEERNMRFAPYKIDLISTRPISRDAAEALPKPVYAPGERITTVELVPVVGVR